MNDKIHRTIEDEVVEAFVKVGAIPQAHADDMSKVCVIIETFLNQFIDLCHQYRWLFNVQLEQIKVFRL